MLIAFVNFAFNSGLSKDSELYRECIRKHNGFENYKIEMTEKSHLDMFCKESLVYLSSDAETGLFFILFTSQVHVGWAQTKMQSLFEIVKAVIVWFQSTIHNINKRESIESLVGVVVL